MASPATSGEKKSWATGFAILVVVVLFAVFGGKCTNRTPDPTPTPVPSTVVTPIRTAVQPAKS